MTHHYGFTIVQLRVSSEVFRVSMSQDLDAVRFQPDVVAAV